MNRVPTLAVAVVDDLDGNSVLDDAPDAVRDATGDGVVDKAELERIGVVSDIDEV